MSSPRRMIDPSAGSGPTTGLIVIAGVALGALAFVLYQGVRGSVEAKRANAPVARPASPDPLKLLGRYGQGLEISDVTAEGPAYTLSVENVQFEPGSLGVFRVGFLQNPILKNTRLKVDVPIQGRETLPPEKALESALFALLGRRELASLGLMGGLVSIQAMPLHIQVSQGGREILALEGERVSVDLRRRQLDLEGRIRLSVDDGARTLESSRLHYSLETQQVWTDGEVRLRTPAGQSQILGFRGDAFLRAVRAGSTLPGAAKIGQQQMVGQATREVLP